METVRSLKRAKKQEIHAGNVENWMVVEIDLVARTHTLLPGMAKLPMNKGGKLFARVNPVTGCWIPQTKTAGRGHVQAEWKGISKYQHILVFQALTGRDVTGDPREGYDLHHRCVMQKLRQYPPPAGDDC